MSTAQKSGVRIVIIGGGIGGLSTGIALKRQLNFRDFKIYEQSWDISGTWHHNTYPGCASDVDTHWYSLSTDLNPYWKQSHVPQPELKEYWKQLAVKYSLYDQLVLNRQVTSVDWDNKRQLYRVHSQDTRTKETFLEEAQIVISATGILFVPFHPAELEGVKAFKGTTFHSARWDHSVDLHNKRVAVIGNGCSASQFIPIISEDSTTQIMNFCRSPHWYLQWSRGAFSKTWQRIFAHVPFVMRMYRNMLMARLDLFYVLVFSGENNPRRAKLQKQLAKYIRSQAPPEYHNRLVPDYTLGCKRFIVDTGYLSALHRPNLDLNYDGIAGFTDDGIVTKTGEKHSFDVIIFATGFIVDKYPLKVRGVEGITLQEYYDRKGGPEAYLGVTVPGFPNFYMLGGKRHVATNSSRLNKKRRSEHNDWSCIGDLYGGGSSRHLLLDASDER
ncbi:hypothetical protein NLI96_g6249 [Meripilus lineatus]|uniref:Uncharacterized protein n=1 Tax=Meripilus lineatus TaxID=2056292 RepID=A0AAD5V3R0_9APHY|nr:hypothetical protein NLI96_g6249 [Physisporinus lineatus]